MYTSPAGSRPATPRGIASSTDNSTPVHGTQVRLMQVKVLYTFDDNNKSNCLARCSQPLNIQTAYLEPSTEIGIIELRTCVQAIVAASPELIARLGHDYTVYAYDYSEYETPLVGQGMLSWVLASASTTPMAPAQQSRTMVTGRVCKNLLGLFSDGIKETLEVKLRLVPVPTCLQSEYLASMEKYRDASSLASEAIDGDAWTTFLRANPGFGVGESATHSQYHTEAQHMKPAGPLSNTLQVGAAAARVEFEEIAHHGGQNQLTQPFNSFVNTFHSDSVAPPIATSRPTTPAGSTQRKRTVTSRPSSRASNREEQVARPRSYSRNASFQGQDLSGVEEGPRKRARVMKTDWNGPSAYGTNTESLRVTASVAASIRGHEVPKSHPTASELAAGDLGNRPPTPRAGPVQRRKQVERQGTSLNREAVIPSSDPYVSPYPVHSYDSFLTSPGEPSGSAGSTPQDIPSSPPVPRVQSLQPSSPALPRYSDVHDSGFLSGLPGNFSGDDDDELRRVDEDELNIASRYERRAQNMPSELSITEEIPGDPSLLPRKMPPRRAPAKRRPSNNPARKRGPAVPEVSSPKLPCLPVPFSVDNIQPDLDNAETLDVAKTANEEDGAHSIQKSTLHSQALERSDSCMSDSNMPLDFLAGAAGSKTGNTKRNAGSSMKRKKAIQERLASSIAAGQMPPFCRNCGEISTPTWRKAFIKVETGSPESLQISDNEEGIISVETVAKDDQGTITSFRVIKKMISAEEKDFEEVQMCNPCGIWLFKWKVMRPPEQWTKSASIEIPKPRRRPSKKATHPSLCEEQSEVDAPQQPLASSDEHGTAIPVALVNNTQPRHEDTQNPIVRTPRLSDERLHVDAQGLGNEAAEAALQKAFQSSPPRFPGSKHTPIDLDADISPRPTRRLIFPSPRKPGISKVLDGPSVESVLSSAQIMNEKIMSNPLVQEDKENCPPAVDEEEEHLDHLFEASEAANSPRTPNVNTENETCFKTPSGSSKRQPLMKNDYLSPTREVGPLQATPNRGSITGVIIEQMTPFTAQLTRLISEANYSNEDGTIGELGAGFGGAEGLYGFPDFGASDMNAFSSPPIHSSPTLFSLYEDPAEPGNASWNEHFDGNEIADFVGLHEEHAC